MFAITVNARVHRVLGGTDCSTEEYVMLFKAVAKKVETEDTPMVPEKLYSEESMRQMIQAHMVSFLQTHKLEMRQYTPDIAALERCVASRYNYWTDDIDHTAFFS